LSDVGRLYEAERRAREAAEAAERRAAFLADASEVLASSLDYRTTLAAVARLAVPALADACLVDLVDDDGHSVRVAAVAAEPHGDLLTALGALALDRPAAPRETPVVGIGDGRAHMVVPLVARDRALGVMVFVVSCERAYRAEDADLARALARRAAVAVDNARMYEAAQRALKARDDVLATVSHDLRNPLAAIAASAGALKKALSTTDVSEPTQQRTSRTADIILRSVKRMDALIRDLLDLTRLEEGRAPLDKRPVDVSVLAQDACELFRPVAAERGVMLEHVMTAPMPAPVAADAERVQQVLSNLIGNAVKFSRASGRVAVSVRDVAGGGVEVAVCDGGAGVSEADLPHVFDRFWQAGEHTGGRPRSGSGLGLAIAKAIVEAHGGRIWAESALGVGSTFCFTLPRE
jgi:signal transduction histidine kinase